MLYKAIRLAQKAHEGQYDKGGTPYIMHCLTVMSGVESQDDMIVAVLHDAAEDYGPIVYEMMETLGFRRELIEGIRVLSREYGEKYFDYIQRIKDSDWARIKLIDLRHNSDISRIKNPTDYDFKRAKKYAKAMQVLEE